MYRGNCCFQIGHVRWNTRTSHVNIHDPFPILSSPQTEPTVTKFSWYVAITLEISNTIDLACRKAHFCKFQPIKQRGQHYTNFPTFVHVPRTYLRTDNLIVKHVQYILFASYIRSILSYTLYYFIMYQCQYHTLKSITHSTYTIRSIFSSIITNRNLRI